MIMQTMIQPTTEGARKSMRANHGKDSGPELRLRRALWNAGLRGYRKNVRSLPGKPDIVFGPARLVIFVHGCFWHRCPTCKRNLTPAANAAYWESKFARNVERDRANVVALEAMGYRVETIWECELRCHLGGVVERIRLARAQPTL